MNPEVALFFGLVFVVSILWYDSRRQSTLSGALWVPTIWTCILGSRFIGQWFDIHGSATIEEGSFIDRIVFSILILFALVILFKKASVKSILFSGGKWFIIFLFYCFVSILWSDYPFTAFKRYIKEIGNVLMVMVVLTEDDAPEAIKATIRRSAYVLIPLSIVLIKYYPHLGRQFSPWTGEAYNVGVTTSKNMLGNLCLVAGLYFVWDLILANSKSIMNRVEVNKTNIENFIKLFMIGLIIWLFYKAQSTTATICFFVGIVVFMLSKRTKIIENPKILFRYIIFSFIVYFLTDSIIGIQDIIYDIIGKDKTLTGRSELWLDVLSLSANPVFGTGYDSFWLGDRRDILWEKYWWKPTGSHNGYIESYLNLGIIGIFLIVSIILTSIKSMINNIQINYAFAVFQLVIILVLVIYNWVEVAFHGTILLWFIFILINFNRVVLVKSEN